MQPHSRRRRVGVSLATAALATTVAIATQSGSAGAFSSGAHPAPAAVLSASPTSTGTPLPTSPVTPDAEHGHSDHADADHADADQADSDHDAATDPRGRRGLAHRTGGRCKGLYEVTETPGICTHGPDAPLPGLGHDIDVPVRPLAADQLAPNTVTSANATVTSAAAAAAAAAAAPVCEGDGVAGYRTEVLYVRESTSADRYAQYLPSLRTWSQGVDAIIDASAAETGGSRRIRFTTDSSCAIVVRNVVVPAGSLASFGGSIDAVKAAGYNRTDRKYVMYVDATVLCGVAGVGIDTRADQANNNNNGPSYARVDSGCWSANTAAHEFTHTLGAVLPGAPNISAAGHCTDDYDIMCYKDGTNVVIRIVCADQAHDSRLDCNHDDYFSTNPVAGSWLATHWNTANNRFLIQGTPTTPPTTNRATQINGPGGKCVDVGGDNTAGNGGAVQLWTCQGTAATDQQWTWSGTTLRTLGRCLDVSSGSTASGTKLQIWDCNGSGAQNWQQVGNTLRNPQSGMCIDSPSGSTANGARLRIWDCNGTGAQNFVKAA